jgi:hypothetical protein
VSGRARIFTRTITGALAALVLAAGLAPAGASAPTTRAGGGGGDSAFCAAGRAVKELYDDEAGIDMKDPKSVRQVRRVVTALGEAAPAALEPSFRRLVHFYDLIVSGQIRLVRDEDAYWEASEPAARAAYRIAQVLQRRCRVQFRG